MSRALYSRIIENFPDMSNEEYLTMKNGVGSAYRGKKFTQKVNRIKELYDIKANEKYIGKHYSLTSGDPLKFDSFGPCIENAKSALTSLSMYSYEHAREVEMLKKNVIDYLKKIGIQKSKERGNISEVKESHISFTSSTTQAFYILFQIISKPNDIVIIPAPNYGLFNFIPEYCGVQVEFVDLKEENNWIIDPDDLEEKIACINRKIQSEYGNDENRPKIVAFVNQNPNNPTGKVMGKREIGVLQRIGEISKKNGLYIIDDLIYRDLTYDRNNMAYPIACMEDYFENTISLFGLSKSYGMAAIRSGVVVANEYVSKCIADYIFQTQESLSLPMIYAVIGAFCDTPERNREYEKYFSILINKYIENFYLLSALVDGIDSVPTEMRQKIIDRISDVIENDKLESVIKGIDSVKFVRNMKPESGFFSVLDFTEIKGKKVPGNVINNEIDLFKFLYEYAHVKVLCGQSFVWPKEDQLIVRVTYAIETETLVKAFANISQALLLLK